MYTVYPPEGATADVRTWLEENYPQALIVFHPVFKRWLMFEAPKGTAWTAQRLYEAMVEHHTHVEKTGVLGVPKWAKDRGAPLMRGELKAPPGSWMFQWLRQNDLWRIGKKQWLEEIEAAERKQESDAQKRQDDMIHDVAYESTAPLHLADALRGDTIFRKWRTNAPELKKEESENGSVSMQQPSASTESAKCN